MQSVLAACAVLVVLAVVLSGVAWAEARVRRRGGGGLPMQPFDEIRHPAAHRARLDTEVQTERPAPSPLPGDRLI